MLRKLLVICVLAVLAGYAVYNEFWKEKQQTATQAVQNQEQSVQEALAKQGLEIGKEAPDFQLQQLDGSQVKLSDLKGKKVIVNFWATWCPPCKKEIPEMQAFYEKHKDEIEILAVNYTVSEKGGAQEKVKSFVAEYGVTFPILFDSASEVSNTYRVISLPTSYFIDTKGVIRQKFIGPMTEKYMEKTIQSMK